MTASPLLLLMACQHSAAEPNPSTQTLTVDQTTLSPQQWIRERWNAARADYRWDPPSPKDQSAIAQTVVELVQDAQNCDTPTKSRVALKLEQYGFSVDTFNNGSDHFWFIYEAKDGKGYGAVAIRCGEANEVVLQAPHAIFDQWTGAIVRDQFVDGSFRMAMWNTTHRYRATSHSDRNGSHHPADVAHNHDTVFHQVSLQLMTLPSLRIAQVHGFSQRNEWEIILSLGSADVQAEQLAAQLKPLSSSIGLYGSTASVLGATTNALVQSMSKSDQGRFVHIELNKELRSELKTNTAQQQILTKALKQPW